MINFIKKLLTRKAAYAPQVLSDKQQSLIQNIDNLLAEKCTRDIDATHLDVRCVKVGLFSQHYGVGYIMAYVQKELDIESCAYMPRSVALIVEPDGTWAFYYGVRRTCTPNLIMNELFINALSRTNDARNT